MTLKVFISSKVYGLERERDIVDEVIQEHKFETVRSETWGADPDHSEDVCRRKVRESDLVIFILGRQFSEMTSIEYDEAKKTRKPRLIFIDESVEPEPNMREFLEGIRDDSRFRRKYPNHDELRNYVDRTLSNAIELKFKRNKERDIITRAYNQCSYMNDYFLGVGTTPVFHEQLEETELDSTIVDLIREKKKIEQILRSIY